MLLLLSGRNSKRSVVFFFGCLLYDVYAVYSLCSLRIQLTEVIKDKRTLCASFACVITYPHYVQTLGLVILEHSTLIAHQGKAN